MSGAAGRRDNRFDFIFNVTVGGKDNLSKAGKAAKSAARDWDSFAESIDKSGHSMEVGKERLKEYVATYRSLERGLTKLEVILREKRKAEADAASTEKNLIAIEKQVKATTSYIAKLKEGGAAWQREKAKLDQLTVSQRESSTAAKRAADTLERVKAKYEEKYLTMRKYLKILTQNQEIQVDLGKHTGKLSGQVKKLRTAYEDAKVASGKLTTEMKKGASSQNKTQKELKETTRDVKSLNRAVRDNGKTWDFWHDQRIGTNAGISLPGFRRSLGAIRNQILVLTFATQGLRKVFSEAFQSSRQMESALRGLGSVSLNTGNIMGVAEEKAKNLASSGLLTVSEASAGLKNLLSAGFGLPEATKMMNTLTDAASFNRQGTLKLGEAVVGATQGIKNQNSIMVDNAGITKNLSIMYKEYAAQIGTTMGKLDEAQKRQAILNGIQKEGAVFAGDSAKVLGTMEGALAQFNVTAFNAAAALGDVMQPAITAFLGTVKETYGEVKTFLSDETFKADAMRAAAIEGKELGEAFKGMIESLKTLNALAKSTINNLEKVVNTISKLTGNAEKVSLGFIDVAKAITKVVIISRLFGRITRNSAKAVEKLVAEEALYLDIYNRRTKVGRLINAQTGERLRGLKALRIAQIKVNNYYKEELGLLRQQYVEYKKAQLGLKALGVRAQIAGKRMVMFGKAVKMAGLGLKSFAISVGVALKSLARMTVYLLVMEGILWAWGKLTNKTDEATEAIKDHLDQAYELSDAYLKLTENRRQLEELTQETSEKASPLGISTFALQKEQALLLRHATEVGRLTHLYWDATSVEEQQWLERRIQKANETYEKQRSIVVAKQRQIEAEITQFYETIAGIEQAYADHHEEWLKKHGDQELRANVDHYNDMITQQKLFNERRARLYAADAARAAELEGNLNRGISEAYSDVVDNRIKFQDEVTKELDSFQRKMETVIPKLIVDPEKQAQAQAEAWEEKQLESLNKMMDKLEESLENRQTTWRQQGEALAEELAKGLGAEAGASLIPSMGMFDKMSGGPGADAVAAGKSIERMMGDLGSMTDLDNFKNTIEEINGQLAIMGYKVKQVLNTQETDTSLGSIKQLKDAYSIWIRIVEGLNTVYNENKEAIALQSQEEQKLAEIGIQLSQGKITLTEGIEKYKAALASQTEAEIRLREVEKSFREDQKAAAIERNIENMRLENGQSLKLINMQKALNKGRFKEVSTLRWIIKEKEKSGKITHEEKDLELSLLGIFTGKNRRLAEQAIKEQQLSNEYQNKIQAHKDSQAALMEEKDLYEQLVGGTYKDAQGKIIQLSNADQVAAEMKLRYIEKQIAAGDGYDEALQKWYDNEKARAETDPEKEKWERRMQVLQWAMDQTVAYYTKMQDNRAAYNETFDKLDHDRLQANSDYQKELAAEVKSGAISQAQEQALLAAKMAQTQAKMEHDRKLAQAALKRDNEIARAAMIKDVTITIATAIAKELALNGSPWAAAAAMAGLAVIQVAANAAFNKAKRDAQQDYNATAAEEADKLSAANAAFSAQENAIRGEGVDGAEGDTLRTSARKISGTIKAESMNVTISPTIVVSGEQVFIGSGSVVEFQLQLQQLMVQAMQDAINNREINIGTLGG